MEFVPFVEVRLDNAATRVLVVEDDPNFRKSVARLVARCGFEAVVASDGNEATEVIRAGGVDIVLTDLKMPGRDGHSLTRELRRRRPPIPAIVMSGVGDMADVIKALRNRVVDFLPKPFDEDQLADALERAADAMASPITESAPAPDSATFSPNVPVANGAPDVAQTTPMKPDEKAEPVLTDEEVGNKLRDGLRRLLLGATKDWERLPVVNPRMSEVRGLMERPSCGVDDILQTLGGDPGLAASLLRLANTPFFNTGLPITNLRDACVRLGNRRVISLAVETMAESAFKPPEPPFRDCMIIAWRCALATARICDAVGKHLRRHSRLGADLGDPSDMYIAALLHDAGELALLEIIGNSEYAQLAAQHMTTTAEIIASTHEALGGVLMKRWQLRGPVRRLASRHHGPPAGELLHQANTRCLVMGSWAMAIRSGLSYLPGHEKIEAAPYLDPLGLVEADFEDVCAKVFAWTQA